MAFGSKPAQSEATQGTNGERWELRNLLIVDGQEKTTSKGKVYWRVKDDKNHWYSVWETPTKVTLEVAADNGERIDCAVQIKPGRDGGNPFYTIAAAGAAASQMVEQGNAKAAASVEPGGKNSAFNRRTHPDDAYRMGMWAAIERAIEMVQMVLIEKPETVSYETFIKAKVVEYTNFLNGIVEKPKTHPEEPAATSVESGPTSAAEMPAEYPPDDDDIPL